MVKKDKSGDIAGIIKSTMSLGRSELSNTMKGGGKKGKKQRKEISIGDKKFRYGKYKGNQITVREDKWEEEKRKSRS